MFDLLGFLENATYPDTRVPVVAFLGDSVTHGAFTCYEWGDARASAGSNCLFDFDAVYHAVLQKRLRAVNPWLPVNVINAGVAGDNAPAALSRLDRDVIAHKPDLCVVDFALNDLGEPIDVYRRAMGSIFDRLQGAGISVILLTPNMLNTYVHPDTIPMYRDYAAVTANWQNGGTMTAYVNAAKEEASSRSVPVADAYAKWTGMAESGVDTTARLANRINHPDRDAHGLFADALFETLQAVHATATGKA